jgi:hypothetical protein
LYNTTTSRGEAANFRPGSNPNHRKVKTHDSG